MRIGIFGGAFNPPHKMHKDIALQLIKQDYLDKVIYVPVGNHYIKKDLISDKNRYKMIKMMISPYPNLEVSDYEFGKLTYTCQTLNHFQEQYPNDQIYFICGTDNFKELSTWKNYSYMLKNFNFIIISRNHDNIEDILLKYQNDGCSVIVPHLSYNNVSSTEIRTILKSDRYSRLLIKKIDDTILDYIYQNNLYQ